MGKSAVTFVVWFCVMGAALFLPAGTVDWYRGWIFLGEMMLLSAGTVAWLAKYDPGLLKERMGNPIQRGQSKRDKVFMVTMIVIWHGWIVLMALDVKRWHLSEAPDWVMVTGAALILLGFLAVLRTFRENSFAGSTIEISADQRVISTGPYAIVRHPLYVALTVTALGMPLALGSYWAALLVVPIAALLVWRLRDEEAYLVDDLPGYAEYEKQVRWRLIPGIY